LLRENFGEQSKNYFGNNKRDKIEKPIS